MKRKLHIITLIAVSTLIGLCIFTQGRARDEPVIVEEVYYDPQIADEELAGIEPFLPAQPYTVDKVMAPELDDPEPERWTSLGEFKTTAYCNCKICCGKWSGGPTADGSEPRQGITVAVDSNVIPLGSALLIDGKKYIAQDTGNLVKEKIVDIYFESHEDAREYGVQYIEVFVKEGGQ